MDFKFNLNNYVKVKLTEEGVKILKTEHDNLNKSIIKRGGKGFGDFKLDLDSDGYYKTQMWRLIQDFNKSMFMGNNNLPFNMNVICCDGEEVI
ncbi:hypothetical protein [uncultured Clostridium sp.]|uniref:hypothetical protein n=1 Tax=uncultured Clostridium sp. TaxID=59620 RepID=UPI0032168BA5